MNCACCGTNKGFIPWRIPQPIADMVCDKPRLGYNDAPLCETAMLCESCYKSGFRPKYQKPPRYEAESAIGGTFGECEHCGAEGELVIMRFMEHPNSAPTFKNLCIFGCGDWLDLLEG